MTLPLECILQAQRCDGIVDCDKGKGVSVYEIVGLFLKEEIHDSFAFRVVRGKLQKWINRSPKIVSLWTSAKTVEVESLCDFNETIQKTVPVPG